VLRSAPPGPARNVLVPLVLLLVTVVLTSGCELELDLEVEVERRGSGVVALTVELEPDILADLEAVGLEPFAGLGELRDRTPGWDLRGMRTPAGGAVLRAAADFDRPEELAELVDALHGGLDDEDLRIVDELELATRDGGGWVLRGAAGLLPPASAGARGIGVGFTGDDLAALLEARDDLVDYELRVRFPGGASSPDADHVEDGTVIWDLPVGSVRHVAAEGEAVFPLGPLEIALGGALLLLVIVLLAWWRRRR
jgi:hypothetical protein